MRYLNPFTVLFSGHSDLMPNGCSYRNRMQCSRSFLQSWVLTLAWVTVLDVIWYIFVNALPVKSEIVFLIPKCPSVPFTTWHWWMISYNLVMYRVLGSQGQGHQKVVQRAQKEIENGQGHHVGICPKSDIYCELFIHKTYYVQNISSLIPVIKMITIKT